MPPTLTLTPALTDMHCARRHSPTVRLYTKNEWCWSPWSALSHFYTLIPQTSSEYIYTHLRYTWCDWLVWLAALHCSTLHCTRLLATAFHRKREGYIWTRAWMRRKHFCSCKTLVCCRENEIQPVLYLYIGVQHGVYFTSAGAHLQAQFMIKKIPQEGSVVTCLTHGSVEY